jgi:hypothetical protein
MENAILENHAKTLRDLATCPVGELIPVNLRVKNLWVVRLPSSESMRHFMEGYNAFFIKMER